MADVDKTNLDSGRYPDITKTYRNILKPVILKGSNSIRADVAPRHGLEGELDGDGQFQIPRFPQLQPP